jgi:phosphotransferase system HPr (HPr) family protein
MLAKTVVFRCDEALQMKVVAVLIQKASVFRSSVWLARGDRRANAKSLLGVMSLGIENLAELTVTADGDDENEAIEAVSAYLSRPEA